MARTNLQSDTDGQPVAMPCPMLARSASRSIQGAVSFTACSCGHRMLRFNRHSCALRSHPFDWDRSQPGIIYPSRNPIAEHHASILGHPCERWTSQSAHPSKLIRRPANMASKTLVRARLHR